MQPNPNKYGTILGNFNEIWPNFDVPTLVLSK